MDLVDWIFLGLGIFGISGVSLLGIFKWFPNRLHEKRIRNTQKDKKDFNKFAELFADDIRPELREAPEDIADWLNEYDKNKKEATLGEYLIITKRENKVTGFIFFEYSFLTNILYVGFLGGAQNLKDGSYREATGRLAKYCSKLIFKELNQCRLIVFEVDDENDPELIPLGEKLQSKAEGKKKLFGKQTHYLEAWFKKDLKVFEIGIDYRQPPLHRNQQQSIRQNLLIVPIDWEINEEDLTMDRNKLVELLNFLFFETYEPLSTEQFLGEAYHQRLVDEYEKLVGSLPEKVKLICHTRGNNSTTYRRETAAYHQ